MSAPTVHPVEWLVPPEKPGLHRSHIDIWLLPLDGLPCRRDYLDAGELARLDGFKYASGRQQYCVAHSALRKILSRYLACSPEQLALTLSPGGKPRIEGDSPGLYFNLSHAGRLALLAVRKSHEVGIDIETLRNIPNLNRIARRVFSNREINWLEQSEWNPVLFFTLWSQMEARQKCLGRGVFGLPTGENTIQTLGFQAAKDQFAAVAWQTGAKPKRINYYQADT